MKKLTEKQKQQIENIAIVRLQESIEDEKYYIVKLWHTYGGENVYVKTKIYPAVLDLWVAYLQFKASDNNCNDLSQQIVGDLFVKYLGCELVEPCKEDENIDLYENWEYWANVSNEVELIHWFKNDEILEELNKSINQNNN